jgi:hypothetical protein
MEPITEFIKKNWMGNKADTLSYFLEIQSAYKSRYKDEKRKGDKVKINRINKAIEHLK